MILQPEDQQPRGTQLDPSQCGYDLLSLALDRNCSIQLLFSPCLRSRLLIIPGLLLGVLAFGLSECLNSYSWAISGDTDGLDRLLIALALGPIKMLVDTVPVWVSSQYAPD